MMNNTLDSKTYYYNITSSWNLWQLSILKTHGNHLIKAHGKLWLLILDPWHLFISYHIINSCSILHHNIHNIYFQNSWQLFTLPAYYDKKNHWNITLFHYSGCYHILFKTHWYFFYLKLMVDIILKKYWRSLFKSPKENIIYKIIHGKSYEKPFKLLFKSHGN